MLTPCSGSTLGLMTLAPALASFPVLGYKVSKTALHMLSLQWALALAEEGFVVVTLDPGVSIDPLFRFSHYVHG